MDIILEKEDLLLQFGSFYVPDFGMSFKPTDNIDLLNIGRVELGNLINFNKTLAFHPDINIKIFNDYERNMVIDIRKLLNRYYSSEEEYVNILNEMLEDSKSLFSKFLEYNEVYLTNYYNKKYEININNAKYLDKIKSVNIEYYNKEEEKSELDKKNLIMLKTVQFDIRLRTFENKNNLLQPVYRKYYNFRSKEKELLKKFLNDKRKIYFRNELEFFSWSYNNNEFYTLLEWNSAFVLQKTIELLTCDDKNKYNIKIKKLTFDLEILNKKIGRDNNNY